MNGSATLNRVQASNGVGLFASGQGVTLSNRRDCDRLQ